MRCGGDGPCPGGPSLPSEKQSRAQIQRGADHRNRCLRRHDRKASVGRVSGGAGPTPSDGVRVVVADDDAAFVEALVLLVNEQPGLTVAGAAANGLEAIELVDALRPEAVVIDLHMPLLDGVTAIARLRRDNPSLCLIALTGDDAPKLHAAVTEAGADGVLLKSELVDGLVERLANLRMIA